MQTNLKTFLVVAVLVVVALFAGLLYYVIYLNSGNQLLAIVFGGVVLVFGGYAAVYLFGLADGKRIYTTSDTNIADHDIPANLPKLLCNRSAIALLDGLCDAGFLDEQYQPTPNMPLCQKAYIAGSLCEILNTGQKWDTFEKFWEYSGLRQSYTNTFKRVGEIAAAILAIVVLMIFVFPITFGVQISTICTASSAPLFYPSICQIFSYLFSTSAVNFGIIT